MSDHEIKMDTGNRILMVISVLVLGAVLAFLLMHLASFLSQLGLAERDAEPVTMVEQRIAPLGRVVAAAMDVEVVPSEPRPAAEIYSSVCAACHDAGIAGSPRADDTAEWNRRLDEKGLETLVLHSIQGFQGMPARGGNASLTDEEVENTVAYLLSRAGVDVSAGAVVAVAEEPVQVSAAPGGNAAAGQSKYAACISCHGSAGEGMGIFPAVAGKDFAYLSQRLQQYRAGEMVGPTSPLMIPQAANLSDEDIADLAAYLSGL